MKKSYLYIAAATVFFSTTEIVLKTVAGAFNPVQLTFTRFLVGGLVLLPLALRALKRRGLRLRARELLSFAWIGFIGITVSMTLYQLAVLYTPASVVAVLFSSNPLFVLAFARLLLGERVPGRSYLALGLDVVGILFVVDPLNMRLSAAGVTLTVLSTVLFGLYGAAGRRKSAEYGGVVNTCFGFLFGSGEMMLLSALTHILRLASALTAAGLGSFAAVPFLSGYSLAVLPRFLYICVGITGAGFACYFLAMEETSVLTASLVFFFKPALAPVLALLALGETIPANRWAGIGFILAGALVNLLPPLLSARKKSAPQSPGTAPEPR